MRGASPPDPFVLWDTDTRVSNTYRQTAGRSPRPNPINPAQKTLVLLSSGQSLSSNTLPTQVSPANASAIDNFNVYDGNAYDVTGPLLGCSYSPPTLGPGNIMVRIADTLITNGKFDRVILVPLSVGSTTASMWGDAGGIHTDRPRVAMARLARRGIAPGMTGVTFAWWHDLGVQDFANGTSQAAMAASLASFVSLVRATGFNGRMFLPLESDVAQTSNAVRSAITSIWNGTTEFSGSDWDLNTIGRSSGMHMSDAGSVTAAANAITALAASGAPFQ